MTEAADILGMIEPRFGTSERTLSWFEREPIPGFSGATAKQLVEAGRGAEVQEFIAAVDAGIHY